MPPQTDSSPNEIRDDTLKIITAPLAMKANARHLAQARRREYWSRMALLAAVFLVLVVIGTRMLGAAPDLLAGLTLPSAWFAIGQLAVLVAVLILSLAGSLGLISARKRLKELRHRREDIDHLMHLDPSES